MACAPIARESCGGPGADSGGDLLSDSTILWRRLDRPGHEAARLRQRPDGWALEGAAVFAEEGQGCLLDYAIETDPVWRTQRCRVDGWIGARPIEIRMARNESSCWTLAGQQRPELEGCVDVDLGFSPSTNLLPIRRLALAIGGEAPVRAAWLPFPRLEPTVLEQVYRRTGPRAWRYESAGGRFARDLEVDDAGLVRSYPGLWVAEG